MNNRSPKSATQPRDDVVAGYQFNVTAINLGDAPLDFFFPSFVQTRLGRPIQRLDQRERQLGPFLFREPGCRLLQLR